jgi:hypothetical protein
MVSRLPIHPLSFDLTANDTIIEQQGILFNHFQAMECPLGLVDRYDSRAEHVMHDTCQNGMIYTFAGKVYATYSSNSADKTLRTQGEIDSSTAMFTLKRTYEDCGDTVTVGVYDKLEFVEQPPLIVERQRVQYNPLTNIDRLQYPITTVQNLIDANGIPYAQGTDFNIVNGNIVWVGNRPGINTDSNRGVVYQVRYLYQPWWIVKSMTKDIRVSRQNNGSDSQLAKSNIAIICQREFQYMNEQNQNNGSTDPHQLPPSDDTEP